ncbi:MAG: MBL fold metallo-hydrolase [Muribaculaceae bacterium]|nr:MBL fold metallo-hydrolase [Muribaculaceae bacterium]
MSKKIYFEHPELPFEEWSNPYGEASAPTAPAKLPKPLYFCSFGSGSSGNSCYVGSAEGGLIVDVGIRAEDLERGLAAQGVSMSNVKGVLLTHDHSDHVKYVYALLRNHRHLKLFCTNRVLNGMLKKHSISKRIKEYHVPIFKEIPFKMLDFEITAFDVPHDGSDNMGFSIEFDSRRFVIATDLGEVTERARHYMSRATYLIIEANYDAYMLRMGRYPEYLKARIASGTGHLDNRQTAAFLTEIINPGLNHIFLCHLSKDNNTPQIALRTVREALEAKGIKVGDAMDTIEDRKADVQLAALPRFDMTRWFVFRK